MITPRISGLDGWTDVRDGLPEKDGRYQVVLIDGDHFHVTMRKYKAAKKHWFTGLVTGQWERGTCGVVCWKPMSELPYELQPYKDTRVLGYFNPVLKLKF